MYFESLFTIFGQMLVRLEHDIKFNRLAANSLEFVASQLPMCFRVGGLTGTRQKLLLTMKISEVYIQP